MLAVDSGGRLLMYRGTGAGAFAPAAASRSAPAGARFTALLAPGDWSGDGKPDLLARTSDGRCCSTAATGAAGSWAASGEQIGSGWQSMTALLAPRDWNGDGNPDILARTVRRARC